MPDQEWAVANERMVLDHPFVKVAFQEVRLPDGQTIQDWPIVRANNYVNALVVDEADRFMILEGYKHGLGRSSWQIMGGFIEPGEEPLSAVQRELLEETGYHCDHWQHLGSFVVDANRHVGNGHFFLARKARKIAEPDHDDLEQFTIRWISLDELFRALFDGRIAIMSYAVNIALGLLTLEKSAG